MPSGLLAMGVTMGVFTVLSVLLLLAEKRLADYGTCTISINEGESTFHVQGGGTLLNTLYENKVFIPSACGGKGSCGHCKVTILEGGGPVLPTETPFMSRTELRTGVRLACQVKVKENISIRIPEELLYVKEFQARVAEVKKLTYDIKEINISLLEPTEINHYAGQYIQVLAPGPDGPVYRAYSISIPEHVKDRVQLIVRLVPGGIASTYLHNLQEGDQVTFTGPYGEFRLNEDPEVELVLVGGGCGMAPLKNIIYTVYNRWPERSCWLFFGARTTSDVFYLDAYRALQKEHPSFKPIYALSDPLGEDEQWDGETGFIHLSVEKYLEAGKKRQAFLCGPPPMIEATMEVLKAKKLKQEAIFYDKF